MFTITAHRQAGLNRGYFCCAHAVPCTVTFHFLYLSGYRIHSVEHLLSALEGCGIDNARIEIEGGTEVPIIDGSALGWCIALQKVFPCQTHIKYALSEGRSI